MLLHHRLYVFIFILTALAVNGLPASAEANKSPDNAGLTQLRQHAEQHINNRLSNQWVNQQASSLSRWLVGAPVLEISALQSNLASGTDELEMRLGVQLQRLDNLGLYDQLTRLNTAIIEAQQQQQQLIVSGLLRQRLWQAALVRQQVTALEDKQEWLEQLGEQLTQRFKAGELSRLAYLQWQQQQLDVKQALISASADLSAAMRAYSELTGESELPETFSETIVGDIATALNRHPEIRLLTLQRQYTAGAYEYGRQSQVNWDVALVARRLTSSMGDENQIGLAVGIPLAFNAPANPGNLQAWQQSDLAFSQNLMNLQFNLQQQLTLLSAKLASLSEQVAISQKQLAIGDEIVKQLTQLRQNSELEQSNWLQSLLEQHDRRYQLQLLQLEQQQLIAQINQLAGQVL